MPIVKFDPQSPPLPCADAQMITKNKDVEQKKSGVYPYIMTISLNDVKI